METKEVAEAAIHILGSLINSYVEEGYCDPTLYGAIDLAGGLTVRLQEVEPDLDLTQMLFELKALQIEAGEVMNQIIEEHNLPVEKNTFVADPTHPRFDEMIRGE